jgi:hypothetical protein
MADVDSATEFGDRPPMPMVLDRFGQRAVPQFFPVQVGRAGYAVGHLYL